jgi:hypothetical protein
MKSQEANTNTLVRSRPGQERVDAAHDFKTNPRNTTNTKSRRKMQVLHQPDEKILNTAGKVTEAVSESVNSSTHLLTKAFTGVRDGVKQSASNPGVAGKIGLGSIAALFGLKSVKSALELLKSTFGMGEKGARGPGILLNGAQLAIGSTMALGLFRTLIGSPGMFNFGTITLGVAAFALISMIKGNYKNPQSLSARILGIFGIGDSVNSVVDSVSMKGRADNEVLR